jgi:MFS superfamily sulfate permease-like transporter
MVAFGAGIFSLIVFLLKLEKYCTLIPISVLEGFSFGVAITIGFGQFNFALGLTLPKHPKFYENVYETFQHIGDLQANEFVPFLIMYLMLMTLMKVYPGKPWIIFIALVGMIYGFITSVFFKEIKPLLLKDKY